MTQLSPYTEEREIDCNTSDNPHFESILNSRLMNNQLSRRQVLKTTSGAAAVFMAASLVGCGSDDNDNNSATTPPSTTPKPETPQRPETLSFKAVDKNKNDLITVPEGYEATVLYALGDPLHSSIAAWQDSSRESGASYTMRSGDCHDGMHFFGVGSNNKWQADQSARGLLVLNHEYINPNYLHATGATVVAGKRTVEDEVIKEFNAHGVSVVEVKKDEKTSQVSIVKDSVFNRRITATTEMEFGGPVKGTDLVKTRFSSNGSKTRGTHNNCGNGYTPWGTYLTCEENYIGYFARNAADDLKRTAKEIVALNRYGLKQGSGSRYQWETVTGSSQQDLFDRWNASVTADSAEQDYRNGPNTFGWIVEIDPFSTAAPRKRTALGRFAHEDCQVGPAIEGQPLTFYMGDDSRGEYIYKFVSKAVWSNVDINAGYSAGDKYLNEGTLYVAKFSDDGKGQWIELSYGKNGLTSSNTVYAFASQADVLTHARLAGDVLGATKMDRPEWCAVNPKNGEVYVTLTNNSDRGSKYPVDAMNPRQYNDTKDGKTSTGNNNGHIIRFKEANNRHDGTTFSWDIYLFGAQADAASNVNLSGLTDANDFSSPDGMWFDNRGVLWIQTDDGQYTDVTNCMMLAALPGQVGDGGVATAQALSNASGEQTTIKGKNASENSLKRFLVGPKECEITGIVMTPDCKAIFLNVQHPGEESKPDYSNPASFGSHWPATQTNAANTTSRPRSATVVVTRKDGGVIVG
ncbi:PhoX family protein [Alkanindiges illinoisensis]|uniref:PhoX family protein n=1 Tax=Alkanindiges illinoisensis TaxID=197183 RepID=UPI000478C122|nr:PhoX family phosphatase [Alkanindiges illinoisensis]